MKKNIKYQISNIKKKNIFFVILFLVLIYFFFINLRTSLFFRKKDRLNLVFYGPKTAFYSISFTDGVSYFINFPSDVKILVPGGFGYYRLGALAKLVSLEKKPKLFQKSFSAVTSSFVDFYFYPNSNEIYFNKKEDSIYLPTTKQILLNKTNASIFDRAYIFFLFITKTKNQFSEIADLPLNNKINSLVLDERIFFDRLIGYFYKKTYRNEKRTVQLVYTKKEENAFLLTKILEGEGIRVVDFHHQDKQKNNCYIIENSQKFSQTTKGLGEFFKCTPKVGETGSYDIIFELGAKEKEWEVE